ncbi:F-box protein At3g07870-like [Rhododendron vialii]|uniref:F-box protein At3g07870-like n=1 Tax=Rhododendron vialii TaxID=182163 RepID=UPI00265ECAEA|nr:F-box protein At3g07870-like [Rhododendron vialii]
MKRSRASKPKVAAMGPSILSIPHYILMEILSKLPMTTLSNCRCVCSYFRDLISDPQFAQLHLSRSQPSLFLRSYCSNSSMYLVESIHPCVVDSVGDVHIPYDTLLKFKPKSEAPAKGLEVLSSCDGLICFYGPRTYNPYVVCNPVIGEYVIVPQIEKYNFDQCGSGFGFCPRTNRYKVLRFLCPSRGFGLLRLEAEINTLGTNSWRRVGDAPRYLHSYSGGCFLNGALHWIVHDTENCFESMHCFDFGKERFQPFPGPSQFYRFLGQLRVNSMKMGVLKDHLSISHNPTDDVLDIWVMKDYAVQDSWTKDFVIEIPWVVKPYCGQIYQPLMVLINGDILMQFALSVVLVSCNMRDRSIREVMVNGIRPVTKAMTYIPSFVSIKNAAIGRHS